MKLQAGIKPHGRDCAGLFADTAPADEHTQAPRDQTLARRSVRGRYRGYADQVYLRLDRAFRIAPLSRRYVEEVVPPAVNGERDAAEAEAAAIE